MTRRVPQRSLRFAAVSLRGVERCRFVTVYRGEYADFLYLPQAFRTERLLADIENHAESAGFVIGTVNSYEPTPFQTPEGFKTNTGAKLGNG